MIVAPDMMSSVIPARLEYQCGHAALVSLPRIKGESSAQRNERVAREKSAAHTRACDFCGPNIEVVVAAPPVAVVVAAPPVAVVEPPPPVVAAPVVEEPVVVPVAVVPTPVPATNGHVVAEPVVEQEPQPIAPVVTVKPKPARRPRTVTVKRVAAPEPAAPLPVPVPVIIATKPRAVARRKPRQLHPVAPAALQRYTIAYQVERVLTAADIRDALRQVTSLGATQVIAITRQ
jgi:hypothetical protein